MYKMNSNEIKKILINHLDKYNIHVQEHNLTKSISIDELYDVLKDLKQFELSGMYDDLGFRIDPTSSRWDETQQRPYVLMDAIRFNVVWHSHPFEGGFQDFPSREDLHTVVLNPQCVFLIVCQKGIYVMASLSDMVDIVRLTRFYRTMQYNEIKTDTCNDDSLDYDSIQKNFINGIAEKREDISRICIRFIPKQYLNKNILKETIDYVYYRYAYKYRKN